ncbi:hypothetical protein [Actinokineospora fastidiosa]|uniref:Uncharacterized protein n=1 Tax=Actinokineospora fastidiosa TaxID=1816 RepID=A0A918GPB8_9PSEU|nr:hypothetical protein [Actinokineospora fastidiosa]GGS51429.1 hypothetical protein GCM10010171_53090 [Actinokineospora fastidiosa]
MLDAKAAAAALLGMVAVAGYALLPDLRVAVAAVFVVVGLLVRPVSRDGVEHGAATAAVLIGAGLLGQVLVVEVDPAPRFAVALVLAPLAVALLVLWDTVGWVGLGLVVPVIVAALSGEWAAALLAGLAVVAALMAVTGTFWTVLGATAAAHAVGGGAAPVVALTGLAGAPLPIHPVTAAVGVLVPVVAGLVAAVRRDLPGGLAAAAALAAPAPGAGPVPLVVLLAVGAAAALALGPLRGLADRVACWARGAGGISREALIAALGGVAVLLAGYGVPALGLDQAARGGIGLVLLLGAAGVAYWLPTRLGGVLGGLVLAGFAVTGPWQRLGLVSTDSSLLELALVLFSAIGMVVTAAVVAALWLRHRHAGVVAGGALLVLHDLAWLLSADLSAPPGPLAVVGPLIALGVVAIGVRAARGVVLGAAGFTLAAMTARTFSGQGVELPRIAPLTPTDVLLNAQLPDNPAWIVPLLLIALLCARSAAVPLVVVFGTQALLVAL